MLARILEPLAYRKLYWRERDNTSKSVPSGHGEGTRLVERRVEVRLFIRGIPVNLLHVGS